MQVVVDAHDLASSVLEPAGIYIVNLCCYRTWSYHELKTSVQNLKGDDMKLGIKSIVLLSIVGGYITRDWFQVPSPWHDSSFVKYKISITTFQKCYNGLSQHFVRLSI